MDSFRHFLRACPLVIAKLHQDNPEDIELQQVIAAYNEGVYVTSIPDNVDWTTAYPQLWNAVLKHEPGPPNYAGIYMPNVESDLGRSDLMFLARPDKEVAYRIKVLIKENDDWLEVDDGPIANGRGEIFELLRQVLDGSAPFNLMEDLGDIGTPIYDGDPID